VATACATGLLQLGHWQLLSPVIITKGAVLPRLPTLHQAYLESSFTPR